MTQTLSAPHDAARMVFEREARFSPPPGLVLPRFGDVVRDPVLEGFLTGEPYERRRDSLYFDTPDLVLADAGITVRRDRTAGGYDWRLVVTDDATSAYPIRRRLHYPGDAHAVPEPLLDYLSNHHRRRGLVPIASVAGTAHVVPLLLPGNVHLGEVVDEHAHARADDHCITSRQIAVTTPVLNRVGDAILAAITAALLDVDCRLELPTGDLFRFADADADSAH